MKPMLLTYLVLVLCKIIAFYWLRSKEVTTFDQLRDLHVLEKLHDTLHPIVLRHVLTAEADTNVSAMRAA